MTLQPLDTTLELQQLSLNQRELYLLRNAFNDYVADMAFSLATLLTRPEIPGLEKSKEILTTAINTLYELMMDPLDDIYKTVEVVDCFIAQLEEEEMDQALIDELDTLRDKLIEFRTSQKKAA